LLCILEFVSHDLHLLYYPKTTPEVFVKNILLIALCAVLLISCASKRAGMVDSTITEAKVLQALAKANGLETPAGDFLVTAAEKQKADGQTEDAFLKADEAVLQFQIAVQERENKNLSDSLKAATESLTVYRSALDERKKAR
jgi:hypothetical protein